DRELEVSEPGREEDADRRLGHQHDRNDGLVLKSHRRAEQCDDKNIEIEQKTPGGDRQAEEGRPAAQVHSLAGADAAAQLADYVELIESQVEADEDPGERERRHDHSLGHFFLLVAAGAGAVAAGVAFKTESTIAFISSY